VYVKIDLRISNGKDLQQSQESLSKKETQEKIRRNGNNRHYAKRSKQAEDASAVFNKIIELAETKELGPTAIARHPDVLKLNKGKEISYGSMQRIITNEKGKSFFKYNDSKLSPSNLS